MARATVSEAAERTLDAWLAGLMEGKIRIQDLPLCVTAWLHAGEAYGRASRQHEISRLEAEVNYLHYMLTPERDRNKQVQERLQQRLVNATEDDLDQYETLLRQIAEKPIHPVVQASERAVEGVATDGSSQDQWAA